MNERDLGPTVTRREAYRKGWDASRRTTTADLDAATERFTNRYGVQHLDAFERGWCDYAADNPRNPDNVRTWADGFGIWHADAPTEGAALAAIREALAEREGPGFARHRVQVDHVQGSHYVERT